MFINTIRRFRMGPVAAILPLVAIGLGLSLNPPACARQAPVTVDVAGKLVPFVMLPSNHMVVEAKLNGKGPYRFIFDLVAPVTLLSNRAAEASGAIPKNAPRSFLMSARGEGKLEQLDMGDLTAKNVPVIIMDHPAVKALGEVFDKKLDGIIGYTFWARYRTTIDYQAKTMTFAPVEFEVKDLMKELPKRFAGPKVAKRVILAPTGLWGLTLETPTKDSSSPGVPIKSVQPGSPAEAAGLRVGDVLVSLDGRWTTSIADTYAAAQGVKSGQSAAVVVQRDGQEVNLTITPKDGI